ncbi:hypothetical protein CHUAL_013782 [Chamberlinius hualienensis]
MTTVTLDNKSASAEADKKQVTTGRLLTEGTWSWVVLFATFCNSVVIFGQFASSTIYYVIFLREFGESKAYTAWILASFNTAICVAGPLGSVLLPRLGPRLLIVLGAVGYAISLTLVSMATSIPYLIVLFAVNGTCTSLIQTGHLATISAYFPRRFYLAVGIMYAGVGLGALVIGLEMEWAIFEYGWRGATFIQAGLVLQACIGGCLIFPIKKTVTISSSSSDKMFVVNPMIYAKDAQYWLLVLCLIGMYFTLTIVNSMTKNLIVSYNLEQHFWLCLIMIGCGQMMGRMLAGFMAQNFFSPPLYYFCLCTGTGLSCIAFLFARVPWAIVVNCLLYSFCMGQQIVVMFFQMAWVYGQQQTAIIRGYVFMFAIVASFTATPVAGWTVDVTNSYNLAMMISAISCFISGIGGLIIYIIKRKRTANENHTCTVTGVIWTHF